MQPSNFVVILLCCLLSCNGSKSLSTTDYPSWRLPPVVGIVQSHHLAPLTLNDSLSSQLFHRVLDKVATDYNYPAKTAAQEFSRFEFVLDDHLKSGSTTFLSALSTKLEAVDSTKLMATFLRTYTSLQDYQSAFLTPAEKDKWDADFQRSLVGIGAEIELVTTGTGTYPQIKRILAGGPLAKAGVVKAGDQILAVRQKTGTAIDQNGLSLDQVLDQLKGTDDTVIQLTISRGGTNNFTTEVARGKVPESYVAAAVLPGGRAENQVGYLRIPRFYVGNGGCAANFSNSLAWLKERSIQQLIIDLRNNRGGSGTMAKEMMSELLNGGPIMQVSRANGEVRIDEDLDGRQSYSGKMIVLVNQFSGSASELFAGTLQDHQRAVVVGQTTVGKGTVQRFYDVLDPENQLYHGAIKLTIASFYTGAGRSAQFKGITPDISWKDAPDPATTGERSWENALQFADLPPVEIAGDLANVNWVNAVKKSHSTSIDLQDIDLNKKVTFLEVEHGLSGVEVEVDREVVAVCGLFSAVAATGFTRG